MNAKHDLRRYRTILMIGLTIFVGGFTRAATPPASVPDSALIDLSPIAELAYPAAVCYLASVGQLINFYDSQSAMEETMVMSGFCSEYAWTQTGKDQFILDPHRYIYNTNLKLFSGQSLDLYRLAGLVYEVGYLRGGSGGVSVCKNAQTVVQFRDEAEAVARLKAAIAAGHPVQVHLDFCYIAQQASVYYPSKANCVGPSSHFVLIHGYDDQFVYYTDNNPTTSIDVDGDSILDGTGVPLTWAAFLDAWYNGGMINKSDKNIAAGPYYMFYLLDAPVRASKLQVLHHLYKRGVDGPDALRAAALAIAQSPSDGETILRQWLRDRKAEMTPLMADYLDSAGLETIGDTYHQIAALWTSIRENTDWSQVPAVLNEIADLTEAGWNEIALLTGGLTDLALLGPSEQPADLGAGPVTFRWTAPLDWQKAPLLQLAMKEDFTDKKSVFQLKVATGRCTAAMTDTLWLKALAKEDGNRRLLWRVVCGSEVSEPAVFEWNPLAISLTQPQAGYELELNGALQVEWQAPTLAQKLQVVFCTTSEFTNKKTRASITLPKGTTALTIPAKIVAKIKKVADEEGWVYCRIEDANAGKTTVLPSGAVRIKL